MQTLNFSVSGEFITQTARRWFFEEKRDYLKSEKLILSCCENVELTEEEKKELAKDIIEGKKQFIGINELELIDDNSICRSVAEELSERENYKKKIELEKDIMNRPFFYIDSFSCEDRWNTLNEKIKDAYLLDVTDLIEWFGLPDNWQREQLCHGLYVLLDLDKYLDFIFKYFPNGVSFSDCMNKKFEECMTYYWNDFLEECKEKGLSYANMSYSLKEVYERQMKACEFFNIAFPYGELVGKEEIKNVVETEKSILNQDIPAIDKDKECFYFNSNNEYHIKSWDYYVIANFDINSIGIPEKVYKSSYALIAPNGDYFSTSFGGHSTKALSIIATNKLLRQEYVDYLILHNELTEDKRDRALKDIRYYGFILSGSHTALDFLMEKRWCKVSNSSGGKPIPVVNDEIRGMTKEQEKTFFKSRMFFEETDTLHT